MSKELFRRIITSIFLTGLLVIVFFYTYILIISLIIVSIIAWIEFNTLITRIISKNKFKDILLKFTYKGLSLIYLTIFSILIFNGINQADLNLKLIMVYLLSICIFSDIGGLIFGKFFKGKKLTKISPNKTISGTIGSFTSSLILVPIFFSLFEEFNNYFIELVIISIIVSFTCQLGDLFISYLKRKAKVKDTGNLLPGHGGILDRIDGILFAVPVGFVLTKFLIVLV
jgi:phosphatidate cytidylyltransferase